MSDKERRKCETKGCNAKAKSNRSHWCFPCYKKRRTRQLKANNIVWRKRVKKGTAGHHVRYRIHATEWAKKHKTAAIAQAKKYKLEQQKLEALKIIEKDAGKPELKKATPRKKPSGPVVLKRVTKVKAKPVEKAKVEKPVKEKPAIKAKPPTVRKAKPKTEVIIPVTVSVPTETVASA